MTPVRHLREQSGLTQDLLGQLVGTAQATISKYETGRVSPTLKTLDQLAVAVGLQVIVTFVPAERDDEPANSADQRSASNSALIDTPESLPSKRRVELWTM